MPKGIMRNVDFFALMAADLLARLYTAFPVPLDWHPQDFDFEVIFPDEDIDNLTSAWRSTVHWLSKEGYLRLESENPNAENEPQFAGAVLTEKGFGILNSPSIVHTGVKIGERLVQTVGDVATGVGQKAVSDAIDEIFNHTGVPLRG
jgi:hypothetical protein